MPIMTNENVEKPKVYMVVNKDCVLCEDALKMWKSLPNPAVVVSADFLRMVKDGNEAALIAELKQINEQWERWKVTDTATNKEVKDPVPFMMFFDSAGNPKDFQGMGVLHKQKEMLNGVSVKPGVVPDESRMKYLDIEYNRRKKIRRTP